MSLACSQCLLGGTLLQGWLGCGSWFLVDRWLIPSLLCHKTCHRFFYIFIYFSRVLFRFCQTFFGSRLLQDILGCCQVERLAVYASLFVLAFILHLNLHVCWNNNNNFYLTHFAGGRGYWHWLFATSPLNSQARATKIVASLNNPCHKSLWEFYNKEAHTAVFCLN